jgi:hypothetical protein
VILATRLPAVLTANAGTETVKQFVPACRRTSELRRAVGPNVSLVLSVHLTALARIKSVWIPAQVLAVKTPDAKSSITVLFAAVVRGSLGTRSLDVPRFHVSYDS